MSENLDIYGKIMRKFINENNILNIYKSYYPNSNISTDCIKNVIKHYIYNITPDIPIPLNHISVHKTIKKCINCIDKKTISKDKKNIPFLNYLDISQKILYQNMLFKFNDIYRYQKFKYNMKKNGFIYKYLSKDVYIWINTKNKPTNIFFLSFNDIDNLIINKNYLYIEIKNITTSTNIYDTLTFNVFNRYNTINKISKDFIKIFDLYPDTKFNIYCSNITSLFIPYLLSIYGIYINDIYMTDPICYPYNYYYLFNNIHNNDNEYMECIRRNYGIMYILHNLALIELYLQDDISDKTYKKLYSNNTHINFSNKSDYYSNKIELTSLLKLDYNVDIII